MIVCLRESGPIGPLSGAALMATVLLSVGACTDLPFGSVEQAAGEITEVEAPPARVHVAAAPQERMPPPFEPADSGPPPPMPREKPALLLSVTEGDSVNGIALRHGVAARAIIALNGLSRPYWLLVGQRLRLPLPAVSDARRGEPPVEEAPRPAWDNAGVLTTEIAAPAHAVHVTAVETTTPSREVRMTEIETAAPIREQSEAPATMVPADPPRVHEELAPEPPTVQEEPVPEPPASPARRVARAKSTQSSPSSLSALARLADATEVPLPPTRNTFLWPLEGSVISRFGSKPGGMHNDGINIAVPLGSEVRAAQNGVVAYAGNELRGYGNLVLIRHEGGWMTAYAHNDALLVGKGEVVRRGQVISRSGKSGRVSRPQAHFEIRRDGEPQDPLRLLTRK